MTDEAIGHTVDSPDAYPVDPAAGVPSSWPEAPAELELPLNFPLRTTTEIFNRRYSFVMRGGAIYVRSREESGARFNAGLRRQTFEPTPIGYSIQNKETGADESHSPQCDVQLPSAPASRRWRRCG